MISQKELAERIGIKRSSVAVHIANLMKKGLIRGKGYVINEDDYVVVIGGAGIDISGFPYTKLIQKTSNIGCIKLSLGGVGRNIAENIARLGISVKLLSAVGNDMYGSKILNETQIEKLDLTRVVTSTAHASSIYLAIQDEQGDMACAISQMDAIEEVSIQYIQSHSKLLQHARMIVLDTNLNQEVIEYIAETYKEQTLYLDTVSVAKTVKAKKCIGSFSAIKPNRIELEVLTGIKADTRDGLLKNYHFLMDKGVGTIFVSLGDQGVFYGNAEGYAFAAAPKDIDVINANGAGDSFMAGLIYGHFTGMSIENTVQFAIAASVAALTSYETINPDMSETFVNGILDAYSMKKEN